MSHGLSNNNAIEGSVEKCVTNSILRDGTFGFHLSIILAPSLGLVKYTEWISDRTFLSSWILMGLLVFWIL